MEPRAVPENSTSLQWRFTSLTRRTIWTTGGNTERCLTDDIRRALEGARKVFLVLPSATSSKRTNNISPKPMRFKTGKRSRLFRCECPVCTNAVCAVED